MVKISMQYGTSGASAQAYGYWGFMLGPAFHRYHDAHRFAKLACDLVEKHGFIAYRARVHYAMGTVAFWTEPIGTAIDFMRATFRAAVWGLRRGSRGGRQGEGTAFAAAQIQLVDYFYYAALTLAACCDNASVDEQHAWRELLVAHREQLREWAETNPPTFADKHVLVWAEIARLEGRDLDAMRLYERAIQSVPKHGFDQNEALAHEVAARFYLARGIESIGHAYLRSARNGYDRWGAIGKVKQLDARYPHVHKARSPTSFTPTIGTPVGQLDVETVVKASQAVSREIVLPAVIETLMRIAVEHAGPSGVCSSFSGVTSRTSRQRPPPATAGPR